MLILLKAFALLRQLNEPEQVIRWYHEARAVEPSSPYGREMPRASRMFLRKAIEHSE